MEYLLDKNLFTLSAGEKQKIACASVAAMEPEIFILDEPSSNMDLSTILDLKALIEKWKKRGKTVIVAEHRLYYLTTLADRVIYMKEGRIGFDIPMEKFTDLDVETLHKNGLRSQRTVYFFPKTKRFSEKDILHFKNLSFSYGKKFLLHIPEISVPAGAVIAVITEPESRPLQRRSADLKGGREVYFIIKGKDLAQEPEKGSAI